MPSSNSLGLPQRYIVILKDGVSDQTHSKQMTAFHAAAVRIPGNGGRLSDFRINKFSGCVMHMDPETAKNLRDDPTVREKN
jgi:hypothetical protein